MTRRTILVVTGAWALIGVVWGSHMTFGAALQGEPMPFGVAATTAMINALPWIPVTLVIVWLVSRFPLTRDRWLRNLWPHIVAFPALTYFSNILVVLGFWASSGSFRGMEALLRGALFWTSMRIHIAALIYAAIVGLTQSLQHYRAGQARELRIARLEGQLARARMDALNAQLRPHFLLNTLHTIGHLWRSGRSEEADRLLDHLGALFERVQRTTSETHVALSEELEMVEEYLAIEAARFSDRLDVSIDADPEVLGCAVPPLMLQPLVENAIRHGIAQSSAAGKVRVAACRRGSELHLVVEDDGPGLLEDAPSRGTGTGHSNLRRRLDELYGEAATLTVHSAAGSGYTVEVTVPAQPDEVALT